MAEASSTATTVSQLVKQHPQQFFGVALSAQISAAWLCSTTAESSVPYQTQGNVTMFVLSSTDDTAV